ncbi:hypothetical protein D3C86_2002800 [compost metagenome]
MMPISQGSGVIGRRSFSLVAVGCGLSARIIGQAMAMTARESSVTAMTCGRTPKRAIRKPPMPAPIRPPRLQ